MSEIADLCSDEDLLKATDAANRDTGQGLRNVEALQRAHPGDPRLHFLRGSLLAALQRYADAEGPMRRAIEIAPGFHIARFQLGLLLLSSGAPGPAAEVWAPLSGLEPLEPLRMFAEGLQ